MKRTIHSILHVFLSPLKGSWRGLFFFFFLLFASCQTEGDYYMQEEGVAPVKAEFKYMADTDARYRVEFGGLTLADTLPNQWMSSVPVYVKESGLTDMLRIYRLADGARTLESETEYTFKPFPVNPSSSDAASVSLVQLAAGAPVQVLQEPKTPADSAAIALQFFFADERVPERVKITIMAVDQYSLILKNYKLGNVPDDMKTEAAEVELTRGVLSETVELNLNFYGEVNNGLAARFLYKVSDAGGTILQDYKVGSSAVATVEIKPESKTVNKKPRPVYQSAVMQWTYQSEAVPFATPKVLMNGEKW